MTLSPTKYWEKIRTKLTELSLLPRNIRQEIYEVTQAIKGTIIKQDAKNTLKLRQYRARLFRKEAPALKVSKLIEKYNSKWNSAFGGSDGVGFVLTAVLGVAGISALAFVATKGLSIYKEFNTEKRIMEAVKSRGLTVSQARELIKVGKAPRVDTVFSTTSKMLNMIPLIGIGAGLWWLNTSWKNS